ncbi:MAG TPA: M56 family metallopeptidase [Vicinamibacterales bacterium]|nr:M56 family metallopeptidase [Vicinamibacterales bacterium]
MAWWLFQNIVMTAALAGVVVVVCRATRVGPVGRHALWVLVLLKFVTPPLVEWPWAAPDPLRVASIDLRVADEEDEDGRQRVDDRGQNADGGLYTGRTDLPERRSGSDAWTAAPYDVRLDSTMAQRAATVWPWLLGIWIVGSVAVLAIEAMRLVVLARRVRGGAPADPALERRVATLSARMGLRPVAVRVVAGSTPPAVWCLGRPQLLWPADLDTGAPGVRDVCIDGLLVHELAHIKRGDHLVGWIELAAGIAWWWNPLFWYVRASLREQAELACDAWVISALPDGRRAYADSLLALSGAAPRGSLSMAVVGVRASSRQVLERRLAMIMQGRVPLRLTRVGVVSLVFAGALTLPAWAASQAPPPPPPAPPPPVAVRPETPPPTPPPAPAPMDVMPMAIPVPSVAPQQPPPPPPPPVRRLQAPTPRPDMIIYRGRTNLPEDATALLRSYETDSYAMMQELTRRMEAGRNQTIAALEALQERYTKAGQLDEAVAVRDYLRAGAPGLDFNYALRGSGAGRGGLSSPGTARGRGGRGGGVR